jgi:hypothetical protein
MKQGETFPSRSIRQAEAKWRHERVGENAIGYGIGLRYID